MREIDKRLAEVLEAAAKLQELVPDAVLVGGTAAAFYASHRTSEDHDHVLGDLNQRFDMVLEAVESREGWITNRVVPNKLIPGELGDIEAGVRQLIRSRPLEVTEITFPSGRQLRVPTLAETLRIKGYLIVSRNQTRDYLDVAVLTDFMGLAAAASTLALVDDYYADQRPGGQGVASQLVRQLAEPRPKDSRTTRELHRYKQLDSRWHDWTAVAVMNQKLSAAMLMSGLEQVDAGE